MKNGQHVRMSTTKHLKFKAEAYLEHTKPLAAPIDRIVLQEVLDF